MFSLDQRNKIVSTVINEVFHLKHSVAKHRLDEGLAAILKTAHRQRVTFVLHACVERLLFVNTVSDDVGLAGKPARIGLARSIPQRLFDYVPTLLNEVEEIDFHG